MKRIGRIIEINISIMDTYLIMNIRVMLLQATIIRNYFVKTQTSVASFSPPDLSIIFSNGMYFEVDCFRRLWSSCQNIGSLGLFEGQNGSK